MALSSRGIATANFMLFLTWKLRSASSECNGNSDRNRLGNGNEQRNTNKTTFCISSPSFIIHWHCMHSVPITILLLHVVNLYTGFTFKTTLNEAVRGEGLGIRCSTRPLVWYVMTHFMPQLNLTAVITTIDCPSSFIKTDLWWRLRIKILDFFMPTIIRTLSLTTLEPGWTARVRPWNGGSLAKLWRQSFLLTLFCKGWQNLQHLIQLTCFKSAPKPGSSSISSRVRCSRNVR